MARSCIVERDRGIGALVALPSESRRSAEGTRGGGFRFRPINPPTEPTLPRKVDPRSLLLVFILDVVPAEPEAGLGLEGTVVALPTSLLEVLERLIFGFESRDAVFEPPPPPPLAVERGREASVVSPPSADSSTTGRASFKLSS